jgi:creatinine amidohydrolase
MANNGTNRMRWEELSVPQIEALDREATILLLPLGSVEQHGRHLPVGTDTMLASEIAIAGAKRLGGRAVVLPSPWYGLSPHHMRFPGTITLAAQTMIALVDDIAASVVAHGFQRLAVVNGHGGNIGLVDLLSSALGHRFYGRARIAGLTYFQLAGDAIARLRVSPPGGMGHACEFETAMMQHLRPDLVAMERAQKMYPDPGSTYLSTDLLGRSRVRTYMDFGDLSESGTLGDPMLASPEAGARFYDVVVEELVQFLEDFGHWKVQRNRKAL